MSAYAVGHLERVEMGADIVEYLRRIDSTLAPFEGRFIVHGGRIEVLEGRFRGDLIVIAFPDIDQARRWYHSPAYQAILPLRTRNADGHVFLVHGVDEEHKAVDVLSGHGTHVSTAVFPPADGV